MSPWARLVLAVASAATGVLVIMAALPRAVAWPLYAIAAFCFLIAACCLTRGRANDLCWSLIGTFLFASTAGYVVAMVRMGRYIGASFSEPSLLWAVFLFATAGWWGALVAWRMGFGLRRRS